MPAAVVLALKDLRLLLCDRAGVFFTFLFPVFYALFFGAIFNTVGRALYHRAIDTAVVEEDRTPESRALIERLKAGGELDVALMDLAAAENQVRLGRRTAYLRIPAGYGAAERRLWGDPPWVEVGVDPRSAAEGGLVRGLVTRVLFEQMRDLLRDPSALRARVAENRSELEHTPGLSDLERMRVESFLTALELVFARDPAQPDDPPPTTAPGGVMRLEPVRVETRIVHMQAAEPPSAYAVSFPQGLIWGVLGCVATFAVTFVSERNRGTLLRLQAAPLSRASIFAGKALACMTTVLAVAAGMLLLATLALRVQVASFALFVLAMVAIAAAFAGLMLLLAALGRTEHTVYGVGWGTLIVLAMIGGAVVPVFYMPEWLLPFVDLSPVRWSLLALEGAVWRSFSLAEMLRPCAVLLGIAGGCGTLGVLALRRRG